MHRLSAIVVTCIGLSLVATACDSEEPEPGPDPEVRAAELWETIDGYRQWSPVPHGQEVEIYAEDMASIDGMNLSADVEEGNLVVCEQYEDGELQVIEAFERVDHGERRWYSARFTPDGELMNHRFRQEIVAITCGDCHGGSGDEYPPPKEDQGD